ncbi:MAG TPA: hypothetical protein VFB22_03620 [Candidatus Baltobacteraceae bacterium]|nr:hypothetical protein [Candidatus Baltobacteraceae bacterium]
MFRLTKALALAAVTASGLLITNLSPALAANTTVDIRVNNTDPSESMKLASADSTFSGYLPIGTQILPGGYDPSATGHITFSAPLPTGSVSGKLQYVDYLTGISECTFTVLVKAVTGGYQLAMSSDNPSRCPAPLATPKTANGDFTSTVYQFDWHS